MKTPISSELSKRLLVPGITVLILFMFMVSCSDDSVTGVDTENPVEVGVVSGYVMAANGIIPIQGAVVRLLTDENKDLSDVPVTNTDSEGKYILEDVPVGEQTILASRGVFEAELDVTVEADEVVEAPLATLLPVKKLAYLPGYFDNIEDILTNELGLEKNKEVEEISPTDLNSSVVLSQYSMVFINCGSGSIEQVAMSAEVLRDYVSDGGVLYISDLELPVLWLLYPDDFPFPMVPNQHTIGKSGMITAEVTDQNLLQFVGMENLGINFDQSGWMGVRESYISNRPKELVRGTFTHIDIFENTEVTVNEPLAVYLEDGDGAVVFTSFHNTGAATADQRAVLTYFVFGFGSPLGTALALDNQMAPIAPHHYPPMKPSEITSDRPHEPSPDVLERFMK